MQKATMPQPTDGPFVVRDDVLSWGRVVRQPQRVAKPHFRDELSRLIAEAPLTSKLAVGLRRSYGDSCLNGAGAMIDATGLDRFIAFDPLTGRFRAEAGVSLSSVLQLIVPHGWFLPTTPGTRFVTLAGAVANDVHGKNHHRAAAFGASVVAVGLLRSDGRRVTLTPKSRAGPLLGNRRRTRANRRDRVGGAAAGRDPERHARRRNRALRQPRRLLAARARKRRQL